MFSYRLLIVFSTCITWSHCKLNEYCALCEDHTMCLYNGIGDKCEYAGEGGVTNEEKIDIVETHNKLRSFVAIGSEGKGLGGAQPKGSNILKLSWDDDLAAVAQRWADQCRFEHDTCRDDPRWRVGQNVYWKFKYPNHRVNWTEAIISWYNEVSLYDPHEVESFRFNAATGHYTQLIWHDTYAVGCGRRDYGYNKLYVCNYGPTGNWIGDPVYSIGEPCSQCPQGMHCDKGLCVIKSEVQIIEPHVTDILDTNSIQSFDGSETTTEKNTKITETIKNVTIHSTTKQVEIKTTTENIKSTTETVKNVNETVAISGIPNASPELFNAPVKVEENDIQLDVETRNDIENLKDQIEQLVIKILKKYRSRT